MIDMTKLSGMSQQDAIAYLMEIMSGQDVGPVSRETGFIPTGYAAGEGESGLPIGPYQKALTTAFDPTYAGGEYGSYMGTYDPSGKLLGVDFQKEERSNGFIGDNLDIIGPLLVGGFAGLGGLGMLPGGTGAVGGLNGGFSLAGIDAIPTAGGLVGGDTAGMALAALEQLPVAGAGGMTGGFPLAGIDQIATVGGGGAASGGSSWWDTLKALGGGANTLAQAGGGWGSLLNGIMQLGTGIYGMKQSREMMDFAKQMDTWGNVGGRQAAAQQLLGLMQDPSSITSVPGYESGMQAVTRSNAAQGYQGSGRMATDLAAYGGNFYTNYMQQLAGLAGAGAQTSPAQSFMGMNSANTQLGNSLGLLGRGFGTIAGSSPVQAGWNWMTQ